MLNKLLQHKLRVLLFAVFVVLLAAVRAFENDLFYDPFIYFFKKDFYGKQLPHANTMLLSLSMLFRYSLNTLFSLGIIYALFKDWKLVRFSAILYGIFFLVAMFIFLAILVWTRNENLMPMFYARRFIIHPILVLLFVPAFYFQRNTIVKQK
ncbi:exosortase F system-associated membrane protein [Flavobacterium sp.]|uniref:exosortase F system-associated membrane protein n=1 Tax=Flavobacterium sp. TaxID=239 RepID=UPI003B9CE54C